MALQQLYINEATALYESVLVRAPSGTQLFGETVTVASTAEIDSWASVLQAGLVSIQQAITDFTTSAEVQANGDQIARLYQGLLGRAPDAAGLAFWTTELNSGALTIQQIATDFVNSQEFANDYLGGGTLSSTTFNDTAFVEQLYTEVLGRTADAAGLAGWVAVLGSNPSASTIASVVLGFTNSAEYQNDSNTAVAAFFAAAAQSALNGTTATTVGTASYESTLSTAGTGHTFTLTTGIDAPGTGAFASQDITGNNNLIVGIFNDSTGTTFTAGDDIVGPAGSSGNTLELSDGGFVAGAANPFSAASTVSGIQIVDIISGEAISANATTGTQGFTGLENLNVTASDSGVAVGSSVQAATTVSISLTDDSQGAQTDFVGGGLNDTVTEDNVTGTGTVNVGQNAGAGFSNVAPLGLINVTENVSTSGTTTFTADAINVTGGTADTVTANLVETAGTGTVTGGAIAVTGTSTTTSVTVTQSAAATEAVAVVASAATLAAAAVAAAPGSNKVAASVTAAAVAAKAAVAGVVDGAVAVKDANANSATLAGTITSVTLNNYGTGSFISDNALSSLTLSGGKAATTLMINDALTTPTATTLALTLNGIGAIGKVAIIDDEKDEYKTINVTTSSSNVINLSDTGLSTLTVAGTGTLTLDTFTSAKLATVTISGSAGFNDGGAIGANTGLAGLHGTLTAFTTTSSGEINVVLDDTTQTFTGSTGQDIVTITANATKTITGGSATDNELILHAASTTFGAGTNTDVTGFQILGLDSASTGSTWNMASLNSSFDSIDFNANNEGTGTSGAAATTETITHAATGTTLSIDFGGDTLTVNYVDTTGSSDTVDLTINPDGTAANSTLAGGITTTALLLADANNVGIGSLVVTSDGNDFNTGGAPAVNVITTLTDNGLSNLTVSGGAGLTITTLDETAHQATAITITSNETGVTGTTITNLTDIDLGNLTFAGTNSGTISKLVVTGGVITTLNITNSGTGTAAIDPAGSFTDATLTSLTLSGNVAFNTNSATQTAATALTNTTGITVSGATDNAHVNIDLTGAAAHATDTISLGNANNEIVDTSTAGTVKVTVGTGSDLIKLGDFGAAGTTANTAAYSVTEGTHTVTAGAGEDFIVAPDIGAYGATVAAAPLVVTGAVAGDLFQVTDNAATLSLVTLSAANLTTLAAAATLNSAITSDVTSFLTTAHSVDEFQYGGNTYVVEVSTASTVNATTSVIELTGTHTIAVTAVNGVTPAAASGEFVVAT